MANSRHKRAVLGFVPTMGALHEGHLKLVERALRDCQEVVVSIFVNPKQFGPKEDFASYPRDLGRDRKLLASVGKVRLFVPKIEEIYPKDFVSQIQVAGPLGQSLEGEYRPGFFDGVATVVARLFGLLRPDRAYFGLKDFQQFLVVQQLVKDLALPLRIIGCPTVREKDGLAMSSRNQYLSEVERGQAPYLYASLLAARNALIAGLNPAVVENSGRKRILGHGAFRLQYFAVRDATTLGPPLAKSRSRVIALAAFLGKTRLIDNVVL